MINVGIESGKFCITFQVETVIFGNCVIIAWNSLSDRIVTCPTVACFKHRIAKLKFML